ncbi:hypothetical protein UA08_02151 [Talaromyces atroroseus]|uniref:EGF-like domain-containing protein n=1 Tax=Talaromyces atroroseus TaxID=1441469 RepID=A0A225AV13_TALAT|nr:hypothetical protein UA08_02151 [Talaromyces atroroseus]OKL62224.1 hypothetical protein UA08_02151 [Talaromyces atroroseus]
MKFLMHVFVASLATVLLTLACTTDDDCSLNGTCQQGTCLCDPGWVASDCGRLDLRPATRYTGYNRTAEGISSWGATVVQDPSDSRIFHLFMAQIAHNCSLNYWTPYSTVVRATSTSGPEGPYQFAGEVVGTFAHNPTVIYSEADGLYILIHIGCPVTVSAGCGSSEAFSCGPGNTNNGESGISAWSSPDLENWDFRGQVMPGNVNGTWDSDTTNPSVFPLWSANDRTHEILMAYRGCIWNCGDGLEQIGVAVAASFPGPYIRAHDHPIFPDNTEDPFVWSDKRGNFHMLVHSLDSAVNGDGSGPNVGRHAYARSWDGQWTYNNETLAYGTYVTFSDGLSTNYSRRERPQLYFSDDGQMTPLFLSNGVQEVNTSQSYTLVQPVGDGARLMSLDPRVSRFSADSGSSYEKPQQRILPTQQENPQPNSSNLRKILHSMARPAPHTESDIPDPSDENDVRAMGCYADYICAYNEWKDWLAKLSDSEDKLESISLQLEHFAGDGMMQQSVLMQWRSERLRWHDLTRLTYIALHKCAFHMTEYHNLLTELYNQADAESGRLAQELREANNTVQELSIRLQATAGHAHLNVGGVRPGSHGDGEVSGLQDHSNAWSPK